jgi:hypothetical protein
MMMLVVGRNRSLILRYYAGIRLEGLRKTTKTSLNIAGRRGRESNPGHSEYDVGLLTTRPQCSVSRSDEWLIGLLHDVIP